MNESKFTGYILSGGRSSRMGTDKAFLKFGKRTFIENAFEILQPNCENIKIVLNKSQTHFIEKLPAKTFHIFDIYENRGALGGMHAAFSDCKTEFAVILAVDLPLVTSDAIESLCKIIVSKKHISAVIPRQIDERLQPICAVYRAKECLPKLEEMLSKNASASVRDFLEQIEIKVINATKISSVKKLFTNVNLSEDFKSL